MDPCTEETWKTSNNMYSRDNFVYSLWHVLSDEVDEEGGLKGWVKYTKNEQTWEGTIEKYFTELMRSKNGVSRENSE